MDDITDEILQNLTSEEIEQLANFSLNDQKITTLLDLSKDENNKLLSQGRPINCILKLKEFEPPKKKSPEPVKKNIDISQHQFTDIDDSELESMLNDLTEEQLNELTGNQSSKNDQKNEQKNDDYIPIDQFLNDLKNNNDKVINLNNNFMSYGVADQVFKFLADPSCVIENVFFSNCGITDLYIPELSDSLAKNNKITYLNIENNRISETGLTKLFHNLCKSTINITELKLTNQLSSFMGNDAEEALKELLQTHNTIIKVSYDARNNSYKNQVERILMKNQDIMRKKRSAKK